MVVPMMGLVADYDGDDFDDEDDEPYDRSRSPSPPRPVFSGTITRWVGRVIKSGFHTASPICFRVPTAQEKH